MKKTYKTIFQLLLTGMFVFFCLPMFAQVDEGGAQNPVTEADTNVEAAYYTNPMQEYAVVARSYGDSIVLRWAPQKAGIWLLANHYGWNIYRDKTESELTENDTVFEIKLNPEPIRPLSLEEMQRRYDSTHTFVGIAAQALYGPSYYNPKEQDGMENYVFRRDQEQTQRQAMAYMAAEGHIDAADALGLRFVDKSVKKGEVYSYRIECLIPEDIALLPNQVIDIACIPFVRNAYQLVPEIQFFQNSPYTAFVFWGKNQLSGYYVERSEDNGKNWTPVNNAPIYGFDPADEEYAAFGEEVGSLLVAHVGFIDSLKLNKKYMYRVRAFDAFGDYAPERKSAAFQMEDLIPPAIPVLDIVIPENNKTCTLNWHVDKEDEDLNGFVVTFAYDPSGPWDRVTDVLPPKTRQWVDKNAHDRGRGYFRVFALDKSGNVSYSLSQINNIEDDVPPSPPQGLAGVVDTSGLVLLQWRENPERDVFGYRVFFANQMDHDFIQRTSQRTEDTLFIDSVERNTLTKYIYYYVVAEDNSHNFSAPSDTLAVPIPDIIPPGVAVLKDYTQTDESVTFTWIQSTSNDVASYYIYRKKDNEKQWKHVRIITPDQLKPDDYIVFTDYPEPSAVNYNYCIEVFDKGRLSSGKTGQTTVRFRGASIVEIPLTLKATLNKNKTCAKLEFTYEYKSKNDYYGVIYKSVNDEPAYAFASFKRGETSYLDCELKSGQKVTYHIQMFLGKGKRSQKSPTATVKG